MASQQRAEQHHRAQTGVTVALALALRKLWRLVDPTDLQNTLPVFSKGVLALAQHYGSASRSLSVTHYGQQRATAGVTGSFRPPLVALPDAQRIDSTVSWATQPLWSNQGGVTTPEAVIEQVLGDVTSAVEQLVLDVGRNEIIAAIEADQHARGWYRVTKPDPCYFCAMLAARGAVYKSRTTATFQAHQRVDGGGGDCRCTAEPSFADFHEPTAQVRDWQRLYNDSTKDIKGSDAKRRAFRRAYEAAQREAAKSGA